MVAAPSASSARLELKDGTVFEGISFGANTSVSGELVFQTGMVGYPESLTDPSYRGQLLVLTFPLIGNYGVPDRTIMDSLLKDKNAYFESDDIHVAALIVADYTASYSHYLATSSLGDWLRERNIPAIYGVDTRALTKKIRNEGSMLGRIKMKIGGEFENVEWVNPNVHNLVAQVSSKQEKIYYPADPIKINNKTPRILLVDVGMKNNQLRCFVKRNVEVKVVPWNYEFNEKEEYDGLFISNGPGDPAIMEETVLHIKAALQKRKVPIFGICLGHQLLSRAAGADTVKLKFGNRGHNIPCNDLITGKCYITSQNHGYAVDNSKTLPSGWKELFVNANDGSNEGIYHESLPYFSVQFHPESTAGPRDTEFLFDVFIDAVKETMAKNELAPLQWPGPRLLQNGEKDSRINVKKVLILGSGGLSIGQAGEFDYSGSQAIKAFKAEGIYTILINPNIATIQTSQGLADKVYFVPVNPEFVEKVIQQERPDAISVSFGGQTALSVGIAMKDRFEELGVRVLGTPISTVITTEDRELFARSMEEIGEKCARSITATTEQEAVDAARIIGYPVIMRGGFALGGLGSGFADNEQELRDTARKAFGGSITQLLIEKSLKGWKEIEYEVVRDSKDNCITVCNMENFDPLGIHTGDSIVVAPSQTLSDEDYNMLRTTAINVIRHLGVVGECNIQYALDPNSQDYCIIEVNARLSRSSALASKATGYPLAFVAAKLALGIPLNEIKNNVTKKTVACFEPSLDYVVVKIPRWDLKKFTRVSNHLSSAMKSVGEVMSIGRTFEEAIQKAIRAVDYQNLGFNATKAFFSIEAELQTPSDQRLFALANAMHSGSYTVHQIWEKTRIDKWFLNKLQYLIDFGKSIIAKTSLDNLSDSYSLFVKAKRLGFSDRQLAYFLDSNEFTVRKERIRKGITSFVKQIDTVAAEFPAMTNYLYTTYNASEDDVAFDDEAIIVLGSGVYRIGSSVEFDWCAVRTVRTLRECGQKTIMINYNPETVSTDYDEADRLYFEVIDLEQVCDIYQKEGAKGVIVSMGGQTANNIALDLSRLGHVRIFGTSPENIDSAENRYKFSRMLDKIGVDQPTWAENTSLAEAEVFCEKVKYPVLVRPSYVLSGAAMNTVYNQNDLKSYLDQAKEVSREYPVVITKYIENAKEIEMDAVAVNGRMVMHFISEHVENAGVHSGDATLILPPQDLDKDTVARVELATAMIADALNVTGPFNIQFIAKDQDIKVIECNVRASRSFPFVSKVGHVDLIEMATHAMLGLPVTPYPPLSFHKAYVGVKVPQFSFSRLSGADPVLGVEMASTGEVACFGRDKYEAYLKAYIATGLKLPQRGKGVLLSIGGMREKNEMLSSVRKLASLGYKLYGTSGTADFMKEQGIDITFLEDIKDTDDDDKKFQKYSLNYHLDAGLIDLYINLPSGNKSRRPATFMSKGYQSRRKAVDYSIPLVTNVKNAKIMIEGMTRYRNFEVTALDAQVTTKSIPKLKRLGVPHADYYSQVKSPEPDSTLSRRPSFPLTSSVDDFEQARSHFYSKKHKNPILFHGDQSKHVLSIGQFNREQLHLIFNTADEMSVALDKARKTGIPLSLLRGKLLCPLFYENSTRTKSSFVAAMKHLGGDVLDWDMSSSSVAKGETLSDTIKTLSQLHVSVFVLRHPEAESIAIASNATQIPIINGGNGSVEHPTQALLDLYTIRSELGTTNGLDITFVGDLLYGRTVHSLVRLLTLYQINRINLVSPPELRLPRHIIEEITAAAPKMRIHEYASLEDEVIAHSNVLYVTRLQRERFDTYQLGKKEDPYIITTETLKKAKKDMIVMHPLPRNDEIEVKVDDDSRAAYFRQAGYGLYVRMALLKLML